MNPIIANLSIAGGLFAALVVTFEIGFRAGRRARAEADPSAGAQVGAIQGAVLGLLGLLLAFSFSAAGTRFLERQDLIVEEANAIGTAYLRADLLAEPYRAELRASLERYTEHRIEVSGRLREGIPPSELAEIEHLQGRIWSAASAGAQDRPAFMLGVLPPINEVIDLHSTRMAAGKKHLPLLVLGLLISCSLLALAVIGYGCGTGGRRRVPMTASLAALVGAALWVTIDLDHPRAGLLRLSDEPLKQLKFGSPRE